MYASSDMSDCGLLVCVGLAAQRRIAAHSRSRVPPCVEACECMAAWLAGCWHAPGAGSPDAVPVALPVVTPSCGHGSFIDLSWPVDVVPNLFHALLYAVAAA